MLQNAKLHSWDYEFFFYLFSGLFLNRLLLRPLMMNVISPCVDMLFKGVSTVATDRRAISDSSGASWYGVLDSEGAI